MCNSIRFKNLKRSECLQIFQCHHFAILILFGLTIIVFAFISLGFKLVVIIRKHLLCRYYLLVLVV